MGSPSYPSDPEEMLVSIQVYFYKTWMGSRAAFNLSFPSPGWRGELVLYVNYVSLDTHTHTVVFGLREEHI